MPPKSSKFLVGAPARRELRTVLRQTTDPGVTIKSFQKSHSLHAMLIKAFHSKEGNHESDNETLDTDSVLVFLNHLGVTQHQVHKRIATMLTSQLEDVIRKSDKEPLLKLLKNCWQYSTVIPDLRPVLQACLKQLGTETPLPVLLRLAERDDENNMKYPDLWQPLPPLLKRLVWEADWEQGGSDGGTNKLLVQLLSPLLHQYSHYPELVEASSLRFVPSLSERRYVTTQRRAATQNDAAKAVSELKVLLSNGDSPAFRPKLLQATTTILLKEYVNNPLIATLAADILLSGPLPKSYQPVLALARVLDETVKEGAMSDLHISQIQQALSEIFPTEDPTNSIASTTTNASDTTNDTSKRIIATIVQESLQAMRTADPQSLFLNPVTDAIAPGYSKVISQPMCMKQMETKKYTSLADFEADVKIMFQNCITYNVGSAGQWFRGEARRQHAVFKSDILAPAKKYLEAQTKAAVPPSSSIVASTTPKRKAGDMVPLIPAKKAKLEENMITMCALSTMLLADPFVVRLLLDRLLRCFRIDAVKGDTIPVAHRAVPSLFQLLHLSFGSKLLDAGLEPTDDLVAYQALRQQAPLVLKLCLEAELDKRLASDLVAAAATTTTTATPRPWKDPPGQTITALLQGALVHVCQPGNTYESSLAVTFCKFAAILGAECANRPFFMSLLHALRRHKSKLGKTNRDAIVSCWLKHWIQTTVGHEHFIVLLNYWASLGNVVLSRDLLIKYSQDAAIGSDFSTLWRTETAIREQYETLLQGLPEQYAIEWKKTMNVFDINV